ncbi:methyltransferase family protein [Marinomonas algicola]|uniref:methyltransferase family protein n=1 Tax=Marinomonas algicola TaxID=2773454 RepID=UPI0019D65475|nr:isoprenylcysteine carboxylmethyltransferase family protein [Marinomonas algicola]
MKLEQKIPPLILVGIFAALMFITEQLFGSLNFSYTFNVLGFSVFILIGVGLAVSGVSSFKKHKTTVNPVNTKNVSALVDSGIFKYTRNPMYVGMLSSLIGYAVYLANPLNIILLGLFILYLNKYQITPEEEFLEKLFGRNYQMYKDSVRRWL